MVVGVLQIELEIPEAQSLKDKRRVIKSLKDRIANAHNVSIAELGSWISTSVRSWGSPWSPMTRRMSKAG